MVLSNPSSKTGKPLLSFLSSANAPWSKVKLGNFSSSAVKSSSSKQPIFTGSGLKIFQKSLVCASGCLINSRSLRRLDVMSRKLDSWANSLSWSHRLLVNLPFSRGLSNPSIIISIHLFSSFNALSTSSIQVYKSSSASCKSFAYSG